MVRTVGASLYGDVCRHPLVQLPRAGTDSAWG